MKQKIRTFNAVEAIKIAERTERNGAAFYQRAAECFEDVGLGDIFRELADWERVHERVFAAMREELAEDEREVQTLDSDNGPVEAEAMAGLTAFGTCYDPASEFAGSKSVRDVLNTAMRIEVSMVVFYTGLKAFVP